MLIAARISGFKAMVVIELDTVIEYLRLNKTAVERWSETIAVCVDTDKAVFIGLHRFIPEHRIWVLRQYEQRVLFLLPQLLYLDLVLVMNAFSILFAPGP